MTMAHTAEVPVPFASCSQQDCSNCISALRTAAVSGFGTVPREITFPNVTEIDYSNVQLKSVAMTINFLKVIITVSPNPKIRSVGMANKIHTL